MDLTDNRAQLDGFLDNALITALIVQMFFVFFPPSYLEAVIIEQTDYRLDEPLALGDIIRQIGIYIFLTTVAGNSRKYFWS